VAVQVAVFPDEPSIWRNGDIHIFATCTGAPHARARLENNCNLYCTGISEIFICDLYVDDTSETWSCEPKN